MEILIIGGTIFLGRHLIDAAKARGHKISLFNRGHHNPGLYPEIEKLRGDRSGSLDELGGRRWDAVIDTCGYLPGIVRMSAEFLKENVEHYTFISSVSVYKHFEPAGTSEKSPTSTITKNRLEAAEKIDTGERATARSYGENYGALEALCEEAAEAAMPKRVLNVRAGLIVGPFDYSDRFTYWVRRVAQGGEILAPGRPDRRIRVIDVRDLAMWIVQMIETRQTGTYNATGAEDRLTMKELLDECQSISGSDASFVWVSEKFLLERKVEPWSELPLWLPEEYNGIFEVSNDQAIKTGLVFRPLVDTVKDTLAWDTTRLKYAKKLQAGLKPGRERQLLRNWRRPNAI